MQAQNESMVEDAWQAFELATAQMTQRSEARVARNAGLAALAAADNPVQRAREVIRRERIYDSSLPDGYPMADFERLVVQLDFDAERALAFAFRPQSP